MSESGVAIEVAFAPSSCDGAVRRVLHSGSREWADGIVSLALEDLARQDSARLRSAPDFRRAHGFPSSYRDFRTFSSLREDSVAATLAIVGPRIEITKASRNARPGDVFCSGEVFRSGRVRLATGAGKTEPAIWIWLYLRELASQLKGRLSRAERKSGQYVAGRALGLTRRVFRKNWLRLFIIAHNAAIVFAEHGKSLTLLGCRVWEFLRDALAGASTGNAPPAVSTMRPGSVSRAPLLNRFHFRPGQV